MSNGETKARILELDLLRGVAIIGVVAVHSTSVMLQQVGALRLTPNPTVVFHEYFNQLTRFSTPLFVFLSGLVLTLSQIAKPLPYPHFLHKRFLRVLVPYVVWIAFLLFIYRGQFDKTTPTRFFNFIINGTADYQLYYIVLTMQLYILFPIFFYLMNKLKTPLRLLFVAGLLAFQVWIFITYDAFRFSKQGRHDEELLRLFYFWVFYFVYGIAAGFSFKQIDLFLRKMPILLAVAVLVLGSVFLTQESLYVLKLPYYDVLNFFRPSTVVYAMSSIAALYRIVLGLAAVKNTIITHVVSGLALLGRHSFGIFLVHTLVLEKLKMTIVVGQKPTVVLGIAVFVVTLLTSLAIVWAASSLFTVAWARVKSYFA